VKINVAVVGADGRMGREVIRAVLKDDNLSLVGAVDTKNNGQDIGSLADGSPCGVILARNLGRVLEESKANVVVDFTTPEIIRENLGAYLNHKVHVVIGTTGLSEEDVEMLDKSAKDAGIGIVIAPNFAIGAILMMKFAAEAAKHLPHVEIIELHHDQKLDAPSGTAIKTAELIKKNRETLHQGHPDEQEKIPGVRGGEFDGLRIHSIRLPGLVAHQEVVFGGLGQTLTIRHDSINRESFMPGVVMAVKKVINLTGVTYGLEKLLI
jgi:4-hydroxy-tetrahydrodipicolinate reductase